MNLISKHILNLAWGGGREMCKMFWLESLKGRDYFHDLGIDGWEDNNILYLSEIVSEVVNWMDQTRERV
jgi:hypothetical protein